MGASLAPHRQLHSVSLDERALRRSPVDRLLSLDAFRGIAVAGMILVNNPGSWDHIYAPLRHASWNGWTAPDLLFPCFLFIVGVAVTLSLTPDPKRPRSWKPLLFKVVRRAALIFALGVFLNGFPRFDWSCLRIPGVLQRIALCYFAASVIVLTLDIKGQVIATFSLLVGYWALMQLTCIAFPDGPETNFAARVDDALLHGHLLYDGWDPEGLLTTVPAIATTLSGVLCGFWLLSSRRSGERVAGLLVAGNLALLLGSVLNQWWPINKNLWSVSYVVFTSGMALNVLGVCDWLIDLKGYRRWATPFIVFGTNPIVAYVLSSLLTKVMLLWTISRPDGSSIDLERSIFDGVFASSTSPAAGSLAYALVYVGLWMGITGFLYHRRVVIKI